MNICIQKSGWASKIEVVLNGTSKGVDRCGAEWAKSRGVRIERFPADWDRYGRGAGPIRNQRMAENADALILIWDGKSGGSASMLKCAKDRGLAIKQYDFFGRERE